MVRAKKSFFCYAALLPRLSEFLYDYEISVGMER